MQNKAKSSLWQKWPKNMQQADCGKMATKSAKLSKRQFVGKMIKKYAKMHIQN